MVLVVDDEPHIAEIMQTELEFEGLDSVVAGNGVQAVEALRTNSGISAIISDVMMPLMDGRELLKVVKENFPHIKTFIFISGYSELSESQAQEMGARAIYSKPVDMDSLLDLIKEEGAGPKTS